MPYGGWSIFCNSANHRLGSASSKRLDLGTYVKLEQAKQACERHYRAGCDLSKAERIIR